jgi:hypothetical protein
MNFGAGPDNVCNTSDDNLAANSNTFLYGHYSFVVSFKQLLRCFPLSVTAVKSQPGQVTFATPPFLAGTAGIRPSSAGGFVIEFRVESPKPTAGTDFASSNTNDAFQVKVLFFTQNVFSHPTLAHTSLDTGNYVDDYGHDFWPSGVPGADPGESGTADTFSRFVVANQPLDPTKAGTFTLKNPPLNGQPQFKLGQAIRVGFTITDAAGNAIPGVNARLTIVKLGTLPVLQQVVSKNNSSTDNIFGSGQSGGLYTLNVDSSFLDGPGTYQFTINSDAAPPQSFLVDVEP